MILQYILTKSAEFESTVSNNLGAILSGLFSIDQAQKFAGDNFMNSLLYNMLTAYAPDEQMFDEIIAPKIKDIGQIYARILNEGLSEDLYNELNNYAQNAD